MSFILDALKKSEAERLRRKTPGIADVPDSARQKSQSHWLWIIGALVVINLSVLAALLMKPDKVQDRSAAVAPVEPAVAAPAAATPPGKSLSQIVAESGPARMETAVATDPVTRAVIDIASETAAPAPAVPRYSAARRAEPFATFHELRAQGTLQLPDLHLDIHVHSSEPADRFVFVNMRKYKERATLDEGPVVREITADGVILEYRGTAFLLPRE